MKNVYIYGLKDPRDGEIHYVGKSIHPKVRLAEHIHTRHSSTLKFKWIQDLLTTGLKPKLIILEEVDEDNWREKERGWIAEGKQEGWPLTNMGFGGANSLATDDLFDYFETYLDRTAWNIFENLTKAQKYAICRATALVMMEHSWAGLKIRDGDPASEFDAGLRHLIGQRVAYSLVVAACTVGQNKLDGLLDRIDKRTEQLLDRAGEKKMLGPKIWAASDAGAEPNLLQKGKRKSLAQ